MNMEQATQFYLEEVLGIQNLVRPSFVSPKGAASNSVQSSESLNSVLFKVEGERPTLLVWVLKQPSAPESELIEKMMAAAKMNSYILFWGNNLTELPGDIFSQLNVGLVFFGDQVPVNTHSTLKLIPSPSLVSMLVGHSAEIQSHKRVAWENIKQAVTLTRGDLN